MEKSQTPFLDSSIGKKVLMSLTGLLMLLFLIAHLVGNLLILRGPEAFNEYSHTLVSMKPWIWVAEFGLLALFLIHIVNGIRITWHNKSARPSGYYGFGRVGHTSRKTPMSSHMIRTGLLIVLFVILHLWFFKFGTEYESKVPGVRDLYRLVVETYHNAGWVIVYDFFMLILGLHLAHGIESAFQTLGIPHRKKLMLAAQGLAVLLSAGFILITLVVYFQS